MRFADVDGTRLHVVRDGASGPLVLFTQGLGGAWYDWDPVVPLLAAEHRLVRFDRPGLGWSQPEPPSGPPRPQTLEGEARRMARLLDELQVARDEKVVVVAHSYGAFHAEAFVRMFPERSAGLVLVDGSVEPDITPKPGGPVRPLAQGLVETLRVLGWHQLIGPRVRRGIFAIASVTHRDPDPVTTRAVYRSSRVAAATANELTSYRPVAVELLELRCERRFPAVPAVLLAGTAGSGAREWLARQYGLARLLGGAEVVELPDAKHLMAADRPDAVAAAVRSVVF
jgi:pimeloyl-ACP methyl ester carboxylesterase